ncbi:MAG: hypothetical protein M1600_13845 [Firmicutes bacterium]|jgi:hypothetical protein|nr:hypothetical protein [Bacillota bacterium]
MNGIDLRDPSGTPDVWLFVAEQGDHHREPEARVEGPRSVKWPNLRLATS